MRTQARLSAMQVNMSGDHPQTLSAATYQQPACAVKTSAGARHAVFFTRGLNRNSPPQQGVMAIVFLKRLRKGPLVASADHAAKGVGKLDRQLSRIDGAVRDGVKRCDPFA